MPRKTYRKAIVTKELLSQVNPKNLKLRDNFLKEKNTRSSALTIEGYLSDLNIFFVYNLLYNDNKYFVDIKKFELAEFFAYVTDELKWGSARFGRMRSCLSSLSQFIEKFMDDQYPDYRNIVLKAIESMPKVTVREKTILSEDQVNGLLSYLHESGKIQECVWLALAIGSGSRFSELLRFTTDIISEDCIAFDGIFLETLKPIKTKGRTRNGKMLVKYIIKDIFLPYYKEWLVEREKILKENNKTHNFIFIKPDGNPAEEGTVRSWIMKFERHLEVPFYPHCLRHYTTTFLSKIGLPQPLIKEIFGWESVTMVEIYDDTTAKDRKWVELDKLKEKLEN